MMPSGEHHLILGGARSGKSRYAQQLAQAKGTPVTFIATARAEDLEMAQRIEHHRQVRPAHWCTLEVPVDLTAALTQVPTDHCIIIDCLTLWLLNCMQTQRMDAVEALLQTLPTLSQSVFLVSNEIGMGVVPATALSRHFVDELGWLHQRIAAQVGRVTLMVAGIPVTVKEVK